MTSTYDEQLAHAMNQIPVPWAEVAKGGSKLFTVFHLAVIGGHLAFAYSSYKAEVRRRKSKARTAEEHHEAIMRMLRKTEQ